MSHKNTVGSGTPRPLPTIPRLNFTTHTSASSSEVQNSAAEQPRPPHGSTDTVPEASNLAHSADLDFTIEWVELHTAVASVFEAPQSTVATNAPQDPAHHQVVQLAHQGQGAQGKAQDRPARPMSPLPSLTPLQNLTPRPNQPVAVQPFALPMMVASTGSTPEGTDKPVSSPRVPRLSNFRSITKNLPRAKKMLSSKPKDPTGDPLATPRQDPPRAVTFDVPTSTKTPRQTQTPNQTPASPRQSFRVPPTSPRPSASRGNTTIGNMAFRQLNAEAQDLLAQFEQHSANEQATLPQHSEPVPSPRATSTAIGALHLSVDELQRGNQAQDQSISQLMSDMFSEPDAEQPNQKH